MRLRSMIHGPQSRHECVPDTRGDCGSAGGIVSHQASVAHPGCVRAAGMRGIVYSLLIPILAGCVIVNPPPIAPVQPTNAPSRGVRTFTLPTPPMPPAPMLVRTNAIPASFRFVCIGVAVLMANREDRDARGIPTGRWEAERRYIVTLQPVPDGTNGPVLWGATRDHVLKLVTTSEAFQQGKSYDLISVE